MAGDEWEKYWQNAEAEERDNLEGEDPVRNNYKLRSFVSTSAGAGRKRRQRDVALVIDRNTGQATQLKDVPTGRLDTIAQGLLGHLPDIDNFFEEFVRRLKVG